MAAGEILYATTFRSPGHLIRLHPANMVDDGGQWSSRILCMHGEASTEAVCMPDASVPRNKLFVSSTLAENLRLPPWSQGYTVAMRKQRLQFGPVIGILCNPRWDEKAAKLRQGPQFDSLLKLVEMGTKRGAVCYLFGLKDIDVRHATTIAYVYEGTRFRQRKMPLPDVIYDQLVSRKIERDTSLAQVRKQLSERYKSRIFNDGFFDKWEVYQWLVEDVSVQRYLPATIRHTSAAKAVRFLQSHAVTFLKPLHGSLGLGIVRFNRHGDGAVQYDVKRPNGIMHGQVTTASEAVQMFQKRLRARPYVWQEGIELLKLRERPMDIRILMQRDGTGAWKRTKMFARIAREGDFTSNLSSGGEAVTVDKMLTELGAKSTFQRKCRSQLRQVANLTVDALERQAKRTFGELGIDLGIDKDGRVWIIEVNSKPHKAPSTAKGSQELVDLAFERPLLYAIHLATTR